MSRVGDWTLVIEACRTKEEGRAKSDDVISSSGGPSMAVWHRKGSVPLVGITGGLIWGPLAVSLGLSSVFSLLSSLSSLLSSLFSLLLVVVVLRRLDPMRRVTHSTHDKPCQLSCCCSELERLALSALFSLLSSLNICPLLPSL